mmetsp:Transcript_15278/g.33000  ORF Transcript_15278/g.33000 Transcript_15278/m.33000 type:complete len:318 (+) Transcript_15278:209-1162(+)
MGLRRISLVAWGLSCLYLRTTDALATELMRTGSNIHDMALANLLNSPTAVALNVTVEAAGQFEPPGLVDTGGVETIVFSSWAIIALLYDEPLKPKEFVQLARALRFSLADSVEVCRDAVEIRDMHAVKVDFIVDPMPVPKPQDKHQDGHAASLLHRIRSLIRSEGDDKNQEHPLQHVNMTQVKAMYEIRVFPEMRLKEAEVARRIDRLQIYHKFADLNRMLAREVASENDALADSVMLDDIGYAARRSVERPRFEKRALESCVEETLLQDARQMHQYIMGISLVLILLITCAGSVVFTVKAPSLVPSRMNPLIGSRM